MLTTLFYGRLGHGQGARILLKKQGVFLLGTDRGYYL